MAHILQLVRPSSPQQELVIPTVMVGTAREQGEGTVKAALDRMMLRLQPKVPFTGHHSMIAPVLQKLWQGHDSLVEITFMAWLSKVCLGTTCELIQGAQPSNVCNTMTESARQIQ